MLLPFLLMACSSDDSVGAEKSGEEQCVITYKVTAGNAQTRAEAITSSNFAIDNRQFRIWAWMTDETGTYHMTSDFNKNALYGIDVTCQSGVWSTNPTWGQFYWPRFKYRLDCCAVYPPDEASTTHFAPTNKTFDFTTSNAVTGNTDIMYATFSGQRESRNLGETSRAVELSFNHIFSQVQFKASKASELSVTITSLEICNVYTEGTFSIGVIGTDVPSWGSTATGLGSYSLPLKSESVALTGEAQSLNAADGMLMLIPQTRTKWNTSQTIAVNDGGSGAKGSYLKIGCSIQMAGSEYNDNGYIYFPIDISWEMGKNYTYTLGFGTGYKANGEKSLTDITLSATVTDWVAGGSESKSDIVI